MWRDGGQGDATENEVKMWMRSGIRASRGLLWRKRVPGGADGSFLAKASGKSRARCV